MPKKRHQQKWIKWLTLLLIGTVLYFLCHIPTRAIAQSPSVTTNNSCSTIATPLTPDEQTYARTAWQYFVKNYQPTTGFTNSVGGYPSGSLWDIGNYLMALNAARELNLIDQGDFDFRVNQFLKTFNTVKLFEDALPNKVYNATTGQMADYGNNPVERGIGWSALDAGRILAALHVIRSCHPQYQDWIKATVSKWKLEKSLKDGQLFGATILPNKETSLVQEGRLGYEQYAARGYELWGLKAAKALTLEQLQFVEINGVKIPVDKRDFNSSQANNYVVSESYILDGIEFGLEGYLQDYAASVLEVQKRRFETTGQLTAVSEDNIDQDPYFLYNTIYANGVPWATITDENKPYPKLRSISTKAAFGWRYLYPENAYAQKVFDAVKDLRSPDGDGYYAGLYEETKQPNKALTGNTNGLILEILYYKARGNRPLIGSSSVTFAPGPPSGNAASTQSTPAQNPSVPTASAMANPSVKAQDLAPTPDPTEIAIAPIPPVGSHSDTVHATLTVIERRYAAAAWAYFQANYQSNSGLVNDRSDMKATSLWGLGDYLAALHAARSLNIIPATEFDQRTRHLLATLGKLPLFAGELPARGYDSRSLQPIDYGGNPIPQGTGWSGLDVGRMLAALYNLKSCHPEYTAAVDRIVLDWSYLRVVRNGVLESANVERDAGRISPTGLTPMLTRIKSETRLGYEEYAARGFQLWGFQVDRSSVGGQYKTASVEGVQIPVYRLRPGVNAEVNQYTVSNPFLQYGLEFGFDPQMRSLAYPIFQAQAARYRRTGKFTAAGTTITDHQPYVVNSTIIGHSKAWATLGDDGKEVPDTRIVSTAVAFAFHALFSDTYAHELWQATTDLYSPSLGYYEGFDEKTGKTATVTNSSTNSLILQALLYRATNQQPIVHLNTKTDSPWWQAVNQGDAGRGLPYTATPKARIISDISGTYWAITSNLTGGGRKPVPF